MRLAVDTNILAYAAGVNGAERKKAALAIVSKLPEADTFLPVQVLGELFRVLVRKAGFESARARTTIIHLMNSFPLIETTPSVLLAATDLTVDRRMGIWDAVILAAAAEAGCRFLLSEDPQDGFTWDGVTVVNPFSGKRNALLARVLEE
jgi:predicted nucleic acid-binding protein